MGVNSRRGRYARCYVRQPARGLLKIATAHDVEAVEDNARLVARHLYGDPLRDAGVHHVADQRTDTPPAPCRFRCSLGSLGRSRKTSPTTPTTREACPRRARVCTSCLEVENSVGRGTPSAPPFSVAHLIDGLPGGDRAADHGPDPSSSESLGIGASLRPASPQAPGSRGRLAIPANLRRVRSGKTISMSAGSCRSWQYRFCRSAGVMARNPAGRRGQRRGRKDLTTAR